MFSRQLSANQKADLDSQAINNFRAYLQIPSVHPNVNYGKLSVFTYNFDKT
jgi:aminoacylase